VNETERKMSRNTEYTAQFPAGEYYIGDLCYVMHAEWGELCDLMFVAPGNDMVEGDLSLADGRRVFLASTAYGDGTYNDNKENYYPVDSGSIGIIAVKDIAPTDLENIDSGAVHTFDNAFNIIAHAGLFDFGDVVIDTAYEDSEDDEYDDYDDELEGE
jgi:hypothetical protein